ITGPWSAAYRCGSFQKKAHSKNKSETDKRLLDHGRLAYRCGSFQKKAHSKKNKSETDKRLLDHGRLAYQYGSFQKGRGSPSRNKTPGPWSAHIPMRQLFKGPMDNNVAIIIIIKPNFDSGVI
ncbi:hypothetical protein Tco_1435717, partial [Tanacetum coccineum]